MSTPGDPAAIGPDDRPVPDTADLRILAELINNDWIPLGQAAFNARMSMQEAALRLATMAARGMPLRLIAEGDRRALWQIAQTGPATGGVPGGQQSFAPPPELLRPNPAQPAPAFPVAAPPVVAEPAATFPPADPPVPAGAPVGDVPPPTFPPSSTPQPGFGGIPAGDPGYGAAPTGGPGYGAAPTGGPGYGAAPTGGPGHGGGPGYGAAPSGGPGYGAAPVGGPGVGAAPVGGPDLGAAPAAPAGATGTPAADPAPVPPPAPAYGAAPSGSGTLPPLPTGPGGPVPPTGPVPPHEQAIAGAVPLGEFPFGLTGAVTEVSAQPTPVVSTGAHAAPDDDHDPETTIRPASGSQPSVAPAPTGSPEEGSDTLAATQTWGLPGSADWTRADEADPAPQDQQEPAPVPPAAPVEPVAPPRVLAPLRTVGIFGEHLVVQVTALVDPADTIVTATGLRLDTGERAVLVRTTVHNASPIDHGSLPDQFLSLLTHDGRVLPKAALAVPGHPVHRVGIPAGTVAEGWTLFLVPDTVTLQAVRWDVRPEVGPQTLHWPL